MSNGILLNDEGFLVVHETEPSLVIREEQSLVIFGLVFVLPLTSLNISEKKGKEKSSSNNSFSHTLEMQLNTWTNS